MQSEPEFGFVKKFIKLYKKAGKQVKIKANGNI